MLTDEYLRNRCKLIKAIGQVESYIELAEMIDIKRKSFYNWLRGEYDLSNSKKTLLKDILDDLWIDDINLYI
jgi:hypothetical protein